MRKYYFYLLCFFSINLVSCDTQNNHIELFESVWETVNDTYPDSSFNSTDWVAIGVSYRNHIKNIDNDEILISLLNKMVFELNVSHTFIGKVSEIENKASPYMFSPGSPNIDIRVIGSDVIVTKVNLDSQNSSLEVLLGAQILKIDNLYVEDIIFKTALYPPYNERYKKFLQTEQVLRHLYGQVDSSVLIEFVDIDDNIQEVTIARTARKGKIELTPELPPVYFECEWDILKDEIGFLRFDAFIENHPELILRALDSLQNTNALIIDLRGNNGGSLETQRNVAERFLRNTEIGAIQISRQSVDTVFYQGSSRAYTAPIVILVDEVSISGAELFPASLQLLKRATIIGTQTPGAVMGGTLDFLTEEIAFVHPTLLIKTAHGVNLEGVGVMPDILEALDAELLRNGIDNQLQSAIEHLQRQLR